MFDWKKKILAKSFELLVNDKRHSEIFERQKETDLLQLDGLTIKQKFDLSFPYVLQSNASNLQLLLRRQT